MNASVSNRLSPLLGQPTQEEWLQPQGQNDPLMLESLFFTTVNAPLHGSETPQEASISPLPDWRILCQQLATRTAEHATPDCAFTLLLPDSGEVDVTLAVRSPVGWEIALRFSPAAYRRWQPRETQCKRLLSQTLHGPVLLTIEQRE